MSMLMSRGFQVKIDGKVIALRLRCSREKRQNEVSPGPKGSLAEGYHIRVGTLHKSVVARVNGARGGRHIG